MNQPVVDPRRPSALEQDEVPLGQYLLVLWRFRLIIALAAVVGGGVAYLASRLSPPVYEATARLVVTPVRGQEASTGAAAYAAILNNQSLVESTLQDLGTTRARAGNLSGSGLTFSPGSDGNVLAIRALVHDPQLAARFTNRLAERSVALAREIREADSVKVRDALKVQMDDARVHLDATQDRLEAARGASQVDALEADVDALMGQRRQLLLLRLEVQAERARLAEAEEELARQEPTRPFRRSTEAKPIDPPPSQPTAPAETPTQDRPQVLREDVQSPYANPVYELLAQEVASGRTRIAGLEARLNSLQKHERDRTSLLALYARRGEIDRLETEYSIARDVYESASTRYYEARLQAAAVSPPLQVVDRAVVPTAPVLPRTFRNVVFGVAFAAALAAVAVLIVGSLSSAPSARSGV